ncbi:hypothetical protein LPJ57_011156, partial [Coemansia sp. RSA 486]
GTGRRGRPPLSSKQGGAAAKHRRNASSAIGANGSKRPASGPTIITDSMSALMDDSSADSAYAAESLEIQAIIKEMEEVQEEHRFFRSLVKKAAKDLWTQMGNEWPPNISGTMVKLTTKDKAKIKEVQEIEAQLRASANGASKLVGNWLSSIDSGSDSETDKPPIKAKDIFRGRPARLGVGAKFLSHKEMLAASNSQTSAANGILTSKELLLKRKLGGKKASGEEELSSGAAASNKPEAKESELDDEDSKAGIVASLASN